MRRNVLMPTRVIASSILIFMVVQAIGFKCAGISYPFGILPEGDHYVKIGDDLELFCTLNMSHPHALGHSSKDLSFFSAKDNSRIVTNYTIINETTIRTILDRHYLEDLPRKECYVYCSLKLNESEGFEKNCATLVRVGLEPQEVTNATCISLNWNNLVCEWYPPETYIQTTYTAYVSFIKSQSELNQTSSSGRKRNETKCPKVLGRQNACELFKHTQNTQYRQLFRYIELEIVGENVLGTHTTIKHFNHYSQVKPNQPRGIEVLQKTTESALLKWTIPHPVNLLPMELVTNITYRSDWDPPDKWHLIVPYNLENKSDSRMFNLTGLKYANSRYCVRIYLKVKEAKDDKLWSEPGTHCFNTLPTVPSAAPNTTFGSYYVNVGGKKSDLIIYWHRIPDFLENGDDFGYNVTCVMNNKYNCDIPLIEKTLTYAKYEINNNNEYLFTIYSYNKIGRSINNSTVFVPKVGSIPRPESNTNVRYTNGVHELSWKPLNHKNLSNYTIFWYEEDQSSPLHSKGTIDWIHVDKNETAKNITMESTKKFYDFAIAANFKDGSSSGMVWFSCVFSHDKVDVKVSDVTIGNVMSREADIIWQINCARRSSFGGYYLYYCPVLSPENDDCQDLKEHRELVNEFGKRNVTLKNLKPYTLYRVQVAVMSYNGSQENVGPRSEEKFFETKEDAPSIPLNLRTEKITNSSIVLAWDAPVETNGKLTNYKLKFSHPSGIPDAFEKNISDAVTKYELRDLLSYTWYNFTLRACNSDKCSSPSTLVSVKTRVGVPGPMAWLHVAKNASIAYLNWEKPNPAAGDLNYYEILVANESNKKILNFTGLKAEIPETECNASFKIRAINIDGDKVYKGEWSKTVVIRCETAVPSKSMTFVAWIVCIFVFILVSILLFYIVKRGWLHCRKMKNVDIKLPPGLQSQDLEKDNQVYVDMEKWPPRPNDAIQGTLGSDLAPDEESLLGKKSDEFMDVSPFNMGVKNGGDSSGCSMGRESMSSSVASENHASSDSGAEADQRLNGMGAAFGEWDAVKEATNADTTAKSRGQNRKVSNQEDPLRFTVSEWNTDDPAAPGYTRVGFTDSSTSDKSLPGKGYVTLGSIAPLSVMSGIPPLSPPPKSVNENTYNSLPLDDFPLLFDEESRTPASEAKGLTNPQTNAPPCYIALACLQDSRLDGPAASGAVVNSSRPSVRQSDKSQIDGGGPAESLPYNPSVNDTDKDAPLSRNNGPMPPYVSMIENPAHATNGEDEKDGEEEEEEEEDEEEEEEEGDIEDDGVRLSPDLGVTNKKTVYGIDSALVDKISKDTESHSNYIPHHVFEKESLYTQ